MIELPEEDGWFIYDGKGCPLPYDVFVEKIIHRSGDISIAQCRAGVLDWRHDTWFPMTDIIAYQVEV